MQTFVPYPSFSESAKVIDTKRLGKQIIEAQQIFKALTLPEYGWKNHPATKMWRGHELALVYYAMACNDEWRARRGKDHGAWLNLVALSGKSDLPPTSAKLPGWWGDSRVHDTHKANLLRKDPEHYKQFAYIVKPMEGYFWPV